MRFRHYSTWLFVLTVLVLFAQSNVVLAGIVTPGNLVILRAGTGAAALGTSSSAAFLDEYTTAGAFVQSIPVSSSGATALTITGNSTTEGVISRSQDGNTLVFAGYRADAGTAPGFNANNKVIGTLNLSGTVGTSVAVTDATPSATRSATTVDGSTFYFTTAAAVRYVGTPSGASTSVVIDARNSRQVNLDSNRLYASNGSTAITGKVQTYGTLPTTATAATPIVVLATTDAVNGFALFDLSAGVAGADTLYALSTVVNQLLKYTFNGTTWSADGSLTLASTAATGAMNLTGFVTGSAVDLYLTSSGTLSKITDASGYDGTLAGMFTSLATSGTNTAFRGIGGFVAVPEPTAFLFGGLVCGVIGLGVGARRLLAKRPTTDG